MNNRKWVQFQFLLDGNEVFSCQGEHWIAGKVETKRLEIRQKEKNLYQIVGHFEFKFYQSDVLKNEIYKYKF